MSVIRITAHLILSLGLALSLISCSTAEHQHASHPTAELFPRLLAPLAFSDFAVCGPLSRQGAQRLMKERVKIGSEDLGAYEFLTKDDQNKSRFRAQTCEEYLAIRKQGAFAYTTVDMSMESWFIRASGALKFIEGAKFSKESQLGPSEDLLSKLSVEILGYNDSDEEAQMKKDVALGITIKDYALSGKLKKFTFQGHEMRFENSIKEFVIEEIARGDINGDGLEDALTSVTWHFREGSGRGYGLWRVGRIGIKSPVIMVPDE